MRYGLWLAAAGGAASMAVPAIAVPLPVPCSAGSFSATGNTPCTSASPGFYVPAPGRTSQTPASVGHYVPTSGASSQTAASPGYFVDTTAASEATPAGPGYYVDTSAATGATAADPGYYVDSIAATAATSAGPGYFVSGSGQSAPTAAEPGYYVSGTAAVAATPAGPGYFVSGSGASAPSAADPGYYVSGSAATAATAAGPGFFVPGSAATAPTEAGPGYFVAGSAATSATPAPIGSVVFGTGATSATPVAAGFYAPDVGLATGIACGAGTESYGGAQLCRIVAANPVGGTGPLFSSTLPQAIDFGTVAPGSFAELSFDISNTPLVSAIGTNITDLSLLSLQFSNNVFSGSGFTPTLVLGDGDSVSLLLRFTPGSPAPAFGTLTIGTDQGASFGSTGQSFTFNLSGNNAVPEPGTWLLLFTGFLGIGGLSRRRRARSAPRPALPPA